MASGWDITAVAFDKARQLMAMLDTDAFRKACTVVERCHNITRDVCLPDTAVDPALFTVQLEHEAWDIWCSVSTRLTELTDADDYRAALTLVADRLYDTLHTYFDQVRVNVEDESIRVNRHKMLRVIRNTLSSGIADLSQIVFENSSH